MLSRSGSARVNLSSRERERGDGGQVFWARCRGYQRPETGSNSGSSRVTDKNPSRVDPSSTQVKRKTRWTHSQTTLTQALLEWKSCHPSPRPMPPTTRRRASTPSAPPPRARLPADCAPARWFKQMTGSEWDRTSHCYEVQKKRWRRLGDAEYSEKEYWRLRKRLVDPVFQDNLPAAAARCEAAEGC